LQQEGLIKVRHGSGAVVVSRVAGQKVSEETRVQLRSALTELILAGLSRAEVVALVNEALNTLLKSPEGGTSRG